MEGTNIEALDSIRNSQFPSLTDLVRNDIQLILYLQIRDWILPQANPWDSMTLQASVKVDNMNFCLLFFVS